MESVLLYALGVLVIVVGLVVSIALHELGHLIPAKRFGVKVGQYMIGFGPTLWSRTRGETEYGVKAIPLGGYISMAGMYPPERVREKKGTAALYDVVMQDEELDEADDHRAFYRLPVLKRIVVMLGGPTMNLLLAILMFGIVYVGFGIPTPSTVVGNVAECVIPVSEERGECAPDDPLAPANEAGIVPGDRLIAIDGQAISSWDDVSPIIRERAGATIPVVIERDGAERTVQVTPILTERYVLDDNDDYVLDANGEPQTVQAGFIGIGPAYETVSQPVTAVLPAVGEATWEMGKVIVTLPVRLWEVGTAVFAGEERDPNGPIGLVGIGRIAGEITSLDESPVADRVSSLIGLLGGLNLALFLFNLLPFVPLDGGHVVIAVWEGIRGAVAKLRGTPRPAPIDAARLIPVTLTISAILVGASVLLLIADIVKPVSLFG